MKQQSAFPTTAIGKGIRKPCILFVTEIKPYPLHGGIYIHIYNVLESLCQRFNIIVLAPLVAAECPLHEQVVAWYPLPSHATGLAAKFTNGRYLLQPRPAWRGSLASLLQRYRPQLVWFNYGHWGQYVPLVRQHGAAAVMRTHNVQSALTRQRATTLPWGQLYGLTLLRAWCEMVHERYLFRHFDRIVSVTEIDRRYHARFVGDKRSSMIPNYLNEAAYLRDEAPPRENDLLIVTGSFCTFQNVQGVVWFLREIWPQIQAAHPAVRLQLVGSGAGRLPAAIHRSTQIEVIDGVPDIVPYLRRATIAVVPILHGSGMRFKILEAMATELPIVSTTLGAQGIALAHDQNVLLADRPAEFAQAVITLLQDRGKRCQLAQSGHALLRQHYTVAANSHRIQHLIEEILC